MKRPDPTPLLWPQKPPRGKHARGHQMHANSIAAWQGFDADSRKGQVCRALARHCSPMTDREVCTALGSQDMNYARPAITHLLDEGVLVEVEHVECPVTGRRVRRVWFRSTTA